MRAAHGHVDLRGRAPARRPRPRVALAFDVPAGACDTHVHIIGNTADPANPDRILWGSNWPHPGARTPGYVITDLMPWRNIDDAVVFNLLPTWEPDAAVRNKILVDNPARLFGF